MATALSILLIAAAGGYALDHSWEGWLHPVIDAGRDLYLPEQIRDGTKLYRDVDYFYPPFAPYALALATSLIGSSLRSYTLLGVVLSVIVAATMYRTARVHAGEAAGLTAGFLFVTACMCAATAYGSSFIFPYAHAAVFGMTLFLMFEAAVLRMFVSGAGKGSIAVTIALGALCSITKIEFAAFVIATTLVCGALAWMTRIADPSTVAKLVFSALSGVVATWLAVYLAFSDAGPGGRAFLSNVFPPSLLSGSVAREFYTRVSGMDQLASNSLLAVAGALFVGVQVLLLRGLDSIEARRGRWAVAAMLVLLAAAAALFGTDVFFRGWILIQLLLLPFALRDVLEFRKEPFRRSLIVLPVLLWFAWCGTSRIPLNLAPVWYGTVYILPVLLLIVYVLFEYLPGRSVYSRRSALLWLPLVLVIGFRNLDEQRTVYENKRHSIETRRGVLRDYSADRARVLGDFLRYAEASRISELVVMPEGLTINYLASVETPLRFHTFTAAEMPDQAIERRIVEELDRVRPTHIALTTQEVAAFGNRRFGMDYGVLLLDYARENYVLEREWRTSTFSIFLLRRADDR